jgi:hypothetical protein
MFFKKILLVERGGSCLFEIGSTTPFSNLAAKVREGPLINAASHYNFGKRVWASSHHRQFDPILAENNGTWRARSYEFSVMDGHIY